MKHLPFPILALVSILLLFPKHGVALLVAPSPRLGAPVHYSPHDISRIVNKNSGISRPIQSKTTLLASINGQDVTTPKNDTPSLSTPDTKVPISITLVTGITTTLLGYLYSKCMKLGFKLVWKKIPYYLLNDSSTNVFTKFLQRYPAMYIILLATCGGGAVAYLSSMVPNLFSAHDYVHILSGEEEVGVNGDAEKDVFPSARNIVPVMGLCLMTSLSGFSLGPEAPMVTVGSLAGASLARKYHKSQTSSNTNSNTPIPSKSSLERILAYAGAAGSITGFMNIPIAGPVFALEMTSRDSGIANSAAKSWTTSILASLAGISFIRGIMMPSAGIGGHFDYIPRAAVGAVSGREMIAVGLGCGFGGAVLGTCFHATIRILKRMIWSDKTKDTQTRAKYMGILKKISIAIAIGIISTQYPQTMFWGEGSLQCMVNGQCTPFAATPHGLPMSMMQWAKVNPNVPFTSWLSAIQVGLAKFFAIALASAAKFPGGVIFPLLSNGAGISHSIILGLSKFIPGLAHSLVSPLIVMSFMAATLTSITRTPMATCLILAMTASGITPLSVLLPGALLASYTSIIISDKLSDKSFFEYSK